MSIIAYIDVVGTPSMTLSMRPNRGVHHFLYNGVWAAGHKTARR
jgi:hypothetical protein